MQEYGAQRLLGVFRRAHPDGAVTPIAQVLSTVKAAMNAVA